MPRTRFSVARFHVLRNGQTLPAVALGARRLVGAHGDVARDRAALGRRAVARERRVPRPRGRRRDLGEPEIRRPAVPLARFGRDASIGRDQRKLALERLLGGEDDAQRRALPRRDRRGQDRELGRVFAAAGRTLGLCVRYREKEAKNAPAISNNAVTAAANWRARNNLSPLPGRPLAGPLRPGPDHRIPNWRGSVSGHAGDFVTIRPVARAAYVGVRA